MADRLLDHLAGAIGGVAAVYRRSRFLPERRAALDAWARHVVACGEGSAHGIPAAAKVGGGRREEGA